MRFVKLKVPPDNPQCGALPEFKPSKRTHPERIVFSSYDKTARFGDWGEPNPDVLRPDWEARGQVFNPYLSHREAFESSGKDYDPTCRLSIDCPEILNAPSTFSFGGPGDSYRASSWSTRLIALHLKG